MRLPVPRWGYSVLPMAIRQDMILAIQRADGG